jgi:hypothetical protein
MYGICKVVVQSCILGVILFAFFNHPCVQAQNLPVFTPTEVIANIKTGAAATEEFINNKAIRGEYKLTNHHLGAHSLTSYSFDGRITKMKLVTSKLESSFKNSENSVGEFQVFVYNPEVRSFELTRPQNNNSYSIRWTHSIDRPDIASFKTRFDTKKAMIFSPISIANDRLDMLIADPQFQITQVQSLRDSDGIVVRCEFRASPSSNSLCPSHIWKSPIRGTFDVLPSRLWAVKAYDFSLLSGSFTRQIGTLIYSSDDSSVPGLVEYTSNIYEGGKHVVTERLTITSLANSTLTDEELDLSHYGLGVSTTKWRSSSLVAATLGTLLIVAGVLTGFVVRRRRRIGTA